MLCILIPTKSTDSCFFYYFSDETFYKYVEKVNHFYYNKFDETDPRDFPE